METFEIPEIYDSTELLGEIIDFEEIYNEILDDIVKGYGDE